MQSICRVAIIGLGLMGGSLALALKRHPRYHVTGFDTDARTMQSAAERGAVDFAAPSLGDAVRDADLAVFCTGPRSIIENMRLSFPHLRPGAVLTDICGVKRDILAFVAGGLPSSVDYVGLHPMAGKEVGGFVNADPDIYKGAGFIIVLPRRYKESSLEIVRRLSTDAGAGRIVINEGSLHDEIIAYSSDLMHIASSALCARLPEGITMAHTAGAFRDCTRVANIDAALWTELLTLNAPHVVPCLSRYIHDLTAFKLALERDDKPFIRDFLQRGADNKRAIEGLRAAQAPETTGA